MRVSDSGSTDTVVDFDGVSKRFGQGAPALEDVSMRIGAGDFTVLLGLSGSGKSTLLRHVDGLHRPTSGSVAVLGTDLGQAHGNALRKLRRRVGFVFQQFHLVGALTVLENVCTGALGSLRGPRLGLALYSKRLRHDAMDQLERVGLADRALQRADTLSGGQQQRVAVARALLQRPEILLADEPVASLDPESSEQVMRLISEISRQDRLTVVCSLHQLELAMSWGERIVGLRAGRVVLDAPVEGLSRESAMAIYSGTDSDAKSVRSGYGELPMAG
ncbi:phosphonate ABC transporter ATP-binding protein [Haloactinomyces albus]|uniref:Phosphonate transport system ATP-binding protein n=1 Tax=Haloactinomyces albus TaxID=1352928 RepID=A0AAE4CLV1_9ACTN|nr:phosphonate ABC transporter ATP-binding protein [Haloactinomyces albus]MDR7302605.1 phosphonate transport system ATP-binding protein [Haloactinomyces albus]